MLVSTQEFVTQQIVKLLYKTVQECSSAENVNWVTVYTSFTPWQIVFVQMNKLISHSTLHVFCSSSFHEQNL